MTYVLEHTKIVSLGEKYAADVVELAKVLHLPKVPERIEGYDISNIFGSEAVGSMVVFKNGEADKNEYRKFKIKLSEGEANDIRMLREVLERRFKRAKKSPLKRGAPMKSGRGVLSPEAIDAEKNPPRLSLRETHPYAGGDLWPLPDLVIIDGGKAPAYAKASAGKQTGGNKESWVLPDLIIIDGGKAQRNVAMRVLKQYKLDIPVLAISKGGGLRSAKARDKIFWPGEKEALELPLASPALHVIKRVRDEAHRFAISYHRLLRKKRAFKK